MTTEIDESSIPKKDGVILVGTGDVFSAGVLIKICKNRFLRIGLNITLSCLHITNVSKCFAQRNMKFGIAFLSPHSSESFFAWHPASLSLTELSFHLDVFF